MRNGEAMTPSLKSARERLAELEGRYFNDRDMIYRIVRGNPTIASLGENAFSCLSPEMALDLIERGRWFECRADGTLVKGKA